ncbi:hypothetical protein Acr_00g0095760 [Actinidia rufa]|uniref:Integrase catalytic domain-containing protein n=1 Tax=Actinidia rufa TaxID=165716 RepID=A0A7J0DYJ9_9ERIC|nr:hypothetical protein Acr_00g0095760 [Actinidia rufa]
MYLRNCHLPRLSASSPPDNRAHPMANTNQVPNIEGFHREIHDMAEQMRIMNENNGCLMQLLTAANPPLPAAPPVPDIERSRHSIHSGDRSQNVITERIEPPFTERVLGARISSKFKLPAQLGVYEGKTDLMDHLDSNRQKIASHLFTVHQKETESLKDFVKRFNQAILEVEDPSDKVIIMAMMEGLRPGPLFDYLSKNITETLSALQSKADKYIAVEELAEAKRRRQGKDDHKRKEPNTRRNDYREETRVTNFGRNQGSHLDLSPETKVPHPNGDRRNQGRPKGCQAMLHFSHEGRDPFKSVCPIAITDRGRRYRELTDEFRFILINFLKKNCDVFAWSQGDVPGIDPEIAMHKLPRMAIKAQALADFIVKSTHEGTPQPETFPLENEISKEPTPKKDLAHWILFVDGSSNQHGCGAGLVIQTPSGDYLAKDGRMMAYLGEVKAASARIKEFKIHQIPWEENKKADALANLASTFEFMTDRCIPLEFLASPSIGAANQILQTEQSPMWMDEIIAYLQGGTLPTDKLQARRLQYRSARFCIFKGRLYKRSFSGPLLKCLRLEEAEYVLKEIHEGICGNHSGARFGIPKVIISDNARQFDNDKFKLFYSDLAISHHFSSPGHPQANGQVKVTNRTILRNLKARLERSKSEWAEDLPSILWAYHTTSQIPTGETSYSMVFGTESVILVEIGMSSFRTSNFDKESNEAELRLNLDLLEEKREKAELRQATYKCQVAKYYNQRARHRSFLPGDLVLRRVTQSAKEPNAGKLGPTWEGPYKVLKVSRLGTY